MKALIYIILFSAFTLLSGTDELRLSGYLESKLSYIAADEEVTSANALFRLEGNYDVSDRGKVEVHLLYYYDQKPLDPFYAFKKNSVYSRLSQEVMDGIYSTLDFEERMIYMTLLEIYSSGYFDHISYSSYYPKEKLVMDRAFVKLFAGKFDFTLGKQQIAWGTGYAYNPTDTWNIKDALNPEGPKIGVLASSVQYFFGENSSFSVIAAPGSNFDHWKYGARIKSNIGRYEYSFSALRDRSDDSELLGLPERIQIGTDFAGEIVNDIGFFGEAALSNPRYPGMELSETDSLYLQFSTGLDFTFENGIYIMGEYYFNGLGSKRSSGYDIASFIRLTGGEMSGLGRDYFTAVVSYSPWNDITLRILSATNLDDVSSVIVPGIEYGFHENIRLNFDSSLFLGNGNSTEYGGLLNKFTLSVTGYF
jgi:hypothetical protein